jgi:hypothetical protein
MWRELPMTYCRMGTAYLQDVRSFREGCKVELSRQLVHTPLINRTMNAGYCMFILGKFTLNYPCPKRFFQTRFFD